MDLSGLSTHEYITLIGHYNSLTSRPQIDPAIYERGLPEAAIREMEKKLESSPKGEIKSLGFRFTGDLHRFKFPGFSYIMTLFQGYQKGILPYPGALADQPAKIFDIFDTIEQLRFEAEDRQRREIQREQERIKRGRN